MTSVPTQRAAAPSCPRRARPSRRASERAPPPRMWASRLTRITVATATTTTTTTTTTHGDDLDDTVDDDASAAVDLNAIKSSLLADPIASARVVEPAPDVQVRRFRAASVSGGEAPFRPVVGGALGVADGVRSAASTVAAAVVAQDRMLAQSEAQSAPSSPGVEGARRCCGVAAFTSTRCATTWCLAQRRRRRSEWQSLADSQVEQWHESDRGGRERRARRCVA
jgi:hypothetical protein